MIKPPKAVIAVAAIAGLDIETNMKLSSLISKSHHNFASVLLAFSLFGFLFPHQTNQVKSNHQVNLRTSEQPANPRVRPGQPYNQGFSDLY
jgi:hypothetical protein